MLVDDPLELLVDLVARGEEIVQLDLAQHAAQGGLRDLGGGVEIVLDRDHRALGIDHPEVDHRAHLDGDVVPGDDVLRRHVEGHRLQAHLDHAVDQRQEEDDARSIALPAQVEDGAGTAAEAKDDGPLVLAKDPRHRGDEEQERGDPDEPRAADSRLIRPLIPRLPPRLPSPL